MDAKLHRHGALKPIITSCILLFVLAVGVRVLVWQNNRIEMQTVQSGLTELYTEDARMLASGEVLHFLSGPDPPSDATVLLHPPGYPLLIAPVYTLGGDRDVFISFQILLNSVAPMLVFMIARRIFGFRTGVIAGFLAAISPQFAYHSALFLPDALSAVPILIGLYLVLCADRDDRLRWGILSGVALGLSCWLRSNALLLPLFFAVSVFFWSRGRQIKLPASLVLFFVLTIFPITLRNYAIFEAFIPLSIGSGTTLLEGLGDYDTDGRLEMPKTDVDVNEFDRSLHSAPDVYPSLWRPDGIERDRARIHAAFRTIAKNPSWYISAVVHRGLSTLKLERVPVIAAERDERATTPAILYWLNRPLKTIQGFFITVFVFPLVLLGVGVILVDRTMFRTLIVLAVIPLYYATIQALLHTEYRYILASTYIQTIFVAVAISFLIDKREAVSRLCARCKDKWRLKRGSG